MQVPEHIPHDAVLYRHAFYDRMYDEYEDLVFNKMFEFRSSNQHCESTVWGKYASIDRVHELGCSKERADQAEGKRNIYTGAIWATAGGVRRVENSKGHRLVVRHAPDEGVQHAHICYDTSRGVPKGGVKWELYAKLEKEFSDLLPHRCS